MEAVKQAAVADRIVLTKTDLVDTPERRAAAESLRTRLAKLNPAAPILDAAAGEATPARLLDCGLYDPERKTPDVRAGWPRRPMRRRRTHHHDHHHDVNRHDDRIRAFTLATDAAIPAAIVRAVPRTPALDARTEAAAPQGHREDRRDAGRAAGGAWRAARPAPAGAAPGWPDDDHRTRMVFITRDIEERTIRELFDAFLGPAAPDRPDRAALVDNPLIPFGGVDR